jgi:hypothetical protein
MITNIDRVRNWPPNNPTHRARKSEENHVSGPGNLNGCPLTAGTQGAAGPAKPYSLMLLKSRGPKSRCFMAMFTPEALRRVCPASSIF